MYDNDAFSTLQHHATGESTKQWLRLHKHESLQAQRNISKHFLNKEFEHSLFTFLVQQRSKAVQMD